MCEVQDWNGTISMATIRMLVMNKRIGFIVAYNGLPKGSISNIGIIGLRIVHQFNSVYESHVYEHYQT
jgi:hypothetical protein